MTPLLLLLACGGAPPAPALAPPWPRTLSAWGLFEGPVSRLDPVDGNRPYALTSALFTDHLGKQRFVQVPHGEAVGVPAQGPLDFPPGTVLTKTFYVAEGEAPPPGRVGEAARLVETRLLVHTAEGWVGLPYVWDEAEDDATLSLTGARVPLRVTPPGEAPRDIEHRVPNANQCKGCHETQKGVMSPIGPTLARLNRDDPHTGQPQLAGWDALRLPEGPLPAGVAWDDPAAPLDARARAYLDVNCAHCHAPGGPADTSGLLLGESVSDPRALGLCKPPVAAGRASAGLSFDLVPGQPEASILVHRVASEDPGVMMPELGRVTAHAEGVALLAAWVRSLPGGCEPGVGG